jgi:hypothetical protein
LGGILNAEKVCASGTANLASFTSLYGASFSGMASGFSNLPAATTSAKATRIAGGYYMPYTPVRMAVQKSIRLTLDLDSNICVDWCDNPCQICERSQQCAGVAV